MFPLEPDTVMLYNQKIYVLDAKYYRYGISGNPLHLPNSASINKQITYGEYIKKEFNMKNENLYNAFIMPFNSSNNCFNITTPIGNIGEAIGIWKENDSNFERIQGILIDIRHLMYNYLGDHKKIISRLAESIEKGIVKNNEFY